MNILRYISSQPVFTVSKNEIEKVNLFNKNLRKFYNNYKKLKLVFNSEIEKRDYNAYIIQIKKNKVKIFIPELDIDIVEKCKLESLNRISPETIVNITINTNIIGLKLMKLDYHFMIVKVNITTLPRKSSLIKNYIVRLYHLKYQYFKCKFETHFYF